METKSYIGEKIKELREEKGWTQEELAEETGISRQSISKWEKGKTQPSTESLLLLCQAFGCNFDYFAPHDKKYICDGTGLSEKAVNKLMMIKQTPLKAEIISEIITHPIFDRIISEFVNLHSVAILEKPSSREALEKTFNKYSQRNRQLADKADLDHIRLIEEELKDFRLNGRVVASITRLLEKDTDSDLEKAYDNIKRLSVNLAEDFFDNKIKG